ncbi:cobyrinate a,c-diamide synthase [candidate division KSB1 bacterium]
MTSASARVVIAGMAGDSGKTLIALSILSELHRRGVSTAAFKKGPDFIDAAWLTLAGGSTARNLDIYLMGKDYTYRSFTEHAEPDGINIIEGNRGLYDGMETGENSTAELAKLLQSPVILTCSPVKVTRTAAAHILGCMHFDKDVRIEGVILNKIAGKRHENVVRRAIEETCGIPVLGALPKLERQTLLPDRHLGLITPEETVLAAERIEGFAGLCRDHIDIDQVAAIARKAPKIQQEVPADTERAVRSFVRIGYFSDSAFTFYYPENLEALEREGAELVRISSVNDRILPEVDALYIGGGFPETHAGLLESNSELRQAVKEAAESGLPIYAECGGLIYLAQSLVWKNRTYRMAGVLQITVELKDKPQGHGYCDIIVDSDNPFFPVGTRLKGHEFHYSRINSETGVLLSSFTLTRGVGCFDKRDGLVYKNVLACYTHLHEGSDPGWAEHFIKTAARHKQGNAGDGTKTQ